MSEDNYALARAVAAVDRALLRRAVRDAEFEAMLERLRARAANAKARRSEDRRPGAPY